MNDNEILAHALKNGFLTGSRAFGVNGESSDWDVVIYVDDVDDLILDAIRSAGAVYAESSKENFKRIANEYGLGFISYYIGNIHEINLIVVSSKKELGRWRYATSELKQAMEDSEKIAKLVKDKNARVALFEYLKLRYLS